MAINTGHGWCCHTPTFEAVIYLQNASAPVWPILERTADKLLVISADPNGARCGSAKPRLRLPAGWFGIEVVVVPDSGHLLQIERPETVAGIVRHHLQAKGLLET